MTQEQLLVDFVNTAGIGLHWVGADGTILWANAADYEPLGYTADEFIGHNIVEFHADAHVIEDILLRLASGERLKDYEARLRCKDGSTRSVLINSSVLFDEQGRFIHTRCFTHDITDRKRLDEAKEQFVNILSHDLRNPLGAITAAAHFMLQTGDLPDRHVVTAGRIARSADRMSRMIADLLDFARGRMAGGIPIAPTSADLAAICRHIVEEAQGGHLDRDIRLTTAGQTSGIWDADRIAQVVSNLTANAVEHGHDPVAIAVDGTERDAVVLSVANGGPAIPNDILATIFQPFSRRSTGGERAGLGLGLFIVREIVLAHNGTIDVESTKAAGTRFTVRLPRTGLSAVPPL